MQYHLDEVIDRRNTKSIKWDNDNARDCLPLWVADMDFRVAEPILRALRERVAHGIFGYAYKPQAYFDAVIGWYQRRHGWSIEREHILCTAGIIPTLSAILQAMTREGEGVAIHVPSYNCFFESPVNAGRRLCRIPLREENGCYTIDWQAMEKGLQEAKLFILCNPHNPTGRVWARHELEQIDALCRKYNVFVVSDEIHAPLAFPGNDYTPYATVAQGTNYCVCTSSTKAFNTAGLPISNIIVPDDAIRQCIARAVENNRVGDVSAFSMDALMAAYNESEDWLDQVREYVRDNYLFLRDFIAREHLPMRPMQMEGTYLCWINIEDTGLNATTFCQRLATEQQVLFNAGLMYGDDRYIRVNLACPRSTLEAALQRLHAFCRSLS